MSRRSLFMAGVIATLCVLSMIFAPYVKYAAGACLLVAIVLCVLFFAWAMTDGPAQYADEESARETEARRADAGHPSERFHEPFFEHKEYPPEYRCYGVDIAKGDDVHVEGTWRRNSDGTATLEEVNLMPRTVHTDHDESKGKMSAALARFEGRHNER